MASLTLPEEELPSDSFLNNHYDDNTQIHAILQNLIQVESDLQTVVKDHRHGTYGF